MDLFINMVGLLAALLSTISMVPQVVKIYKTKNTKDLSLMTFVILSSAIFLWFIYGLLIRAFPIIIGNAIGFILTAFIVMMKIKMDKK
ncbi:MAG: SemiSWEET transporter [Syntrophales bacterium]|nr:SemiSWEET transporter [Syntrophales bacterium]